MSETSRIEWTDATWNPVRGCAIVSKGCTNCYAMKQAHRFSGAGQPYEGLTQMSRGGPVWTGQVRLVRELLEQPLRWAKPRRIFVNSMADLFHDDVPFEFIADVFAAMACTTRHTYQVLTKRAARMLEFFNWLDESAENVFQWPDRVDPLRVWPQWTPQRGNRGGYDNCGPAWPLRNVWLGVSVEDQAAADERIPLLLQTPAAVRWISAEPLLGAINLRDAPNDIGEPRFSYLKQIDGTGPQIDWVVVGGESGPGARGCRVADVRLIVRQCRTAGVPVFVKQLGAYVVDRNDAGFDGCDPGSWPDMDPMDIEHDVHGFKEEYQGADVRVLLGNRKGGAMCEWPEDLRVREYPACD